MKRFSTTFLLFIISLSVYSQMTGTWNLDWQSQGFNVCAPTFFTITENAQDSSYTADFIYTSLQGCPGTVTGNYSSILTLGSTPDTYTDIKSNQLTYDADNQAIYYLSYGQTYLYDRNGSYIPQQLAFGPIGGVWADGAFINVSNGYNQSRCCVPESFYIYPTGSFETSITINSNFTGSCTPPTTSTTTGAILSPGSSRMNWTAYDMTYPAHVSYILEPYSSLNELIIQFGYSNLFNPSQIEYFCTYSFQRSTVNVNLISGTWKYDWQSGGSISPSTIEVTIVDNIYMLSTLNYSTGITPSYFIPTGQAPNQYYDAIFAKTFTYDEKTNTLMTVPTWSNKQVLLYSQNGSYLNNTMYDSIWVNPQSTNSTPLPSSCCLPTQLHIGEYPGLGEFFVDYILPSNYADISGCQGILNQTMNNQLNGNLYIANPPSLTLLMWNDNFGSNISFANSSTTSELVIRGFAFGECDFKMEPYGFDDYLFLQKIRMD